MLYALKGNRQVLIDESQRLDFEKDGFDVYDLKDDNKLVLLTKKADPKADAKLIKELEKTKAELEKENAELKAKLAELESKK